MRRRPPFIRDAESMTCAPQLRKRIRITDAKIVAQSKANCALAFRHGSMHCGMLIEIVCLHVKLGATTVHLSRDNLSATANGWGEFKLRVAAALNLQSYFVRRSMVVNAKSRATGVNIVDGK